MNSEIFWRSVAQRLDAGRPVFISLVAAHTRGSPGTLGARMLVDADGGVVGTIGGGIMEVRLIEEGRSHLQQGTLPEPEVRRLVHRKKGTRHPSGLICAGEQTNINLTLEPQRDAATVRGLHRAIADQTDPATTLIVDADGLRIDQDDTLPGLHWRAGDDDWVYRESSIHPKRLAIVGGGHCGKALAQLALQVGYWVDVFDTRPDVLHGEAWADEIRRHTLGDYDELNDHLRHPALTTVVVMTAAVTHDITALASVAKTDLRWLGVMGSAAKIHEIRSQLAQRGIERSRIDAIHGPIGLRMKSDTPAEIAVSIMGQLLTEATAQPGTQRRKHTRRRGVT